MPFPVQPLIPGNGHHCIRDPRRQEEAVHQMVQEKAQEQEWVTIPIQAIIHTQEEGHQGPMGQEEHGPQEEAIQEVIQEAMQAAIQAAAAHLQAPRPHSSQEEQAIQVALRQPHLQDFLIHTEDTPIHALSFLSLIDLFYQGTTSRRINQGILSPAERTKTLENQRKRTNNQGNSLLKINQGIPLDRSRKALPKLSLPSNYKNCSILDMQQILEAWYDKSTFAIATWRGDAQRYWLTQVLDCARLRHDQWLQSTLRDHHRELV